MPSYMFRKISFIFLFSVILCQISQAQEVIQIILQQECVNGMNKIRVLPITPTTNVGDYQYRFEAYTNPDNKNYLTPIYILNGAGNEAAVPDPADNLFALYRIYVKKEGLGDFVLNWYSTKCNHDGLNTYCDENNRMLNTDKLYYHSGESFAATMQGCPGFPVSVSIVNAGNKDNENFLSSNLKQSGNDITGRVGFQPFGFSVFCLTGGGCHGYTTRFIVPVGTTPVTVIPPPSGGGGVTPVGQGNIIETLEPAKFIYKKGDVVTVAYRTNFALTTYKDLEDCRLADRANVKLELSDKSGGWGFPTVLAQEVVFNPLVIEAGTFSIDGVIKDVEEGSNYKLRVKFNHLEREVVGALNPNCKSPIGTKQNIYFNINPPNENLTPISIIKSKCAELERLDFTLTDATQKVEAKAVQIESKNVVKNGSSLVLKADVIDLLDGFDSESPSFFEAIPSGCVED